MRQGWTLAVLLVCLGPIACTSSGSRSSTGTAARVAAPSGPPDAVLLTADGALLSFVTMPPRIIGEPRPIKGVEGRILAIDIRPHTGQLYGISDRSMVYRIDYKTGEASHGVSLKQRFVADGATVADFDPVTDRLRLMQEGGANWLVGVANGAVTVGSRLKNRRSGDRKVALSHIVAGAYTNSVPHAKTTTLYTIEADDEPTLNVQAPPNSGVQQRKGQLGIALGPATAFDIRSTGASDTGWLLTDNTLFAVDLQSGRAVVSGPVAGLTLPVVDLALLPST